MPEKAILFDLDGTLTDSGEGIMNCAALALGHFGIEVANFNDLRIFVGPPLHETFVNFGVPEDATDEAIRIFRSRYLTVGKFENFPYAGIPELLERLRAQGHKLYVATSKPETTSVEILTHFGLAPYFEKICGATMDRSRASKSAVIAYLLSQIDHVRETVMVGDTAFDVLGAKEHGIPTIGVAWGYGKAADMMNAGASAIANTVDELYTLLQK